MSEYASAIALAQKLIAKKGRRDGALVRSISSNVPDPSRPWKPGQPERVILAANLPVVILDAKLMLTGFTSKGQAISKSLSPEATSIAYLAAGAIAEKPRINDLLTSKGETFSVIEVEDLSPGAESILYLLQLKAT